MIDCLIALLVIYTPFSSTRIWYLLAVWNLADCDTASFVYISRTHVIYAEDHGVMLRGATGWRWPVCGVCTVCCSSQTALHRNSIRVDEKGIVFFARCVISTRGFLMCGVGIVCVMIMYMVGYSNFWPSDQTAWYMSIRTQHAQLIHVFALIYMYWNDVLKSVFLFIRFEGVTIAFRIDFDIPPVNS